MIQIASPTLRQKLECSKELCKNCPNLAGITTCSKDLCELKKVVKANCNECCKFWF